MDKTENLKYGVWYCTKYSRWSGSMCRKYMDDVEWDYMESPCEDCEHSMRIEMESTPLKMKCIKEYKGIKVGDVMNAHIMLGRGVVIDGEEISVKDFDNCFKELNEERG